MLPVTSHQTRHRRHRPDSRSRRRLRGDRPCAARSVRLRRRVVGSAPLRRNAGGLRRPRGDGSVGLVTLTRHFPETWEITRMAVHPGWHRRGLRGRMVGAAVARCREEGATTLLVKTLADSHPSEEYAQTRAFYRAMGLAGGVFRHLG